MPQDKLLKQFFGSSFILVGSCFFYLNQFKYMSIFKIYHINQMKFRLFALLLLLLAISEAQSDFNIKLKPEMNGFFRQASKALNTNYLGKFQGETKNEYIGVIINDDMLVSIPVQVCQVKINVIFTVDPNSLISALRLDVLDKLEDYCPMRSPYFVRISGHRIHVRMSQTNGLFLNVLGGDFLKETNSHLEIDDASKTFKLVLRGSRPEQKVNADL